MMKGKGQSIREYSGNRDQARPGEGRASQVKSMHGTKHTRAGSKGSMEMDGDGSGHGSGHGSRLRLRIDSGWGRPRAPPPVMLCE
jgi:hypothetical protein